MFRKSKKESLPPHFNVPATELPITEKKYGDFRDSMHWRVLRIMAEFVNGFQNLADFKKTVTIFGSARYGKNSRWYDEARALGRMLVKEGYSVVTGGGPGIMEAANEGAAEAKGNSIGLNIQLPEEQRLNPYVNRAIGFHYFFTRKVMLSYSAEAYVYFPGGLGTLDEFFEIATLIQTKKIPPHIPLVLIGKEYWGPLTAWIDKELYRAQNAIDKKDMDIYVTVDTAEEAIRVIKKRAKPRNEF